ncbi:hypothetical protein WA026_006033 [Henosepilachna vigintioctopunctata]|uniref:Uncharacterized protein n=1 Tax=Henosepilachna vigintioctopunctata TaxID=420089 RepID=A0AAW1TJF3_9CUCU
MQFLLVLLVCAALTSAEIYNLEAIQSQDNELTDHGQHKYNIDSSSGNMPQLRNYDGTIGGGYPYWDKNGQLKYMEYITNPENYNFYGSYLPITVAPVTDTPEVKAARKAHEEAYNYLKSIRSGLQHSEHVPVITSTPFYKQLEPTTILPVTSKTPLKNYYKTIQVTKTQLGSTETFPALQDLLHYSAQNGHPPKNNHGSVLASSIDNINNYKSSEKQTLDIVRALPKLTPEEHLRALKKVIAEQLRNYVNSSKILQEKNLNEPEGHIELNTETLSQLDSRHHFESSVQNEAELERHRKIAVLAAARALLKILKETN